MKSFLLRMVIGGSGLMGCCMMPLYAADNIGHSPALMMAQADIGFGENMNRQGELNGYKGYRHHRPGYKKAKDGWWYPQAAFDPDAAQKAVNIKKAKTVKTPKEIKPEWSQAHIDSCRSRYKSYNSTDNSYQPFEGARQQCYSRYFKPSNR